jgi:hypothetical protein
MKGKIIYIRISIFKQEQCKKRKMEDEDTNPTSTSELLNRNAAADRLQPAMSRPSTTCIYDVSESFTRYMFRENG